MAPDNLPFGGLALDRVRNRLAAGTPAEAAVSQAHGVLMKSLEAIARGFAWWKSEFRSSRAIQFVTALLLILLIAFTVWSVKHKPKPKPATPWQKLQRTLGM